MHERGLVAAVNLQLRFSPGMLALRDLIAQGVLGTLVDIDVRIPGNGASIGGLKVVTENAWFAARPSGTEDVYKIYAESFKGADHLKQVQAEAKALVDGVIS